MKIITDKDRGRLTIAIEGQLGTASAKELEDVLKANIGDATELVFDFEKLEYLASSGLRLLLASAKTMKKQGSMKIIHVTKPVMNVLTFTGMVDIIDVEEI